MSSRRVVLGLLAAVSTVLGGAAFPASAAIPATGYIAVLPSGGGSPQSDVGQLSVEIGSDSALTALTVSLFRTSDNTDVLDLPMADFATPAHDGDNNYGIWTLTSPITTGQLAIGSYAIEVTATSADATISSVAAGTLNFLNEPQFPTFTSNGTTFGLDNQDVTFSGTATLLAPDGTSTPLENRDLNLAVPSGSPAPLVTGTDGSFTITVVARPGTYWVTSAQDSATGFGNSAVIDLSVTQLPVQIKAALAVKNPDYKAKDSVTGTVSYTDAGSKPLAGVTVSLVDSGLQAHGSTITDANGHFTLPVPTLSTATWSLKTTSSAYFQGAALGLSVTVAQPNWIRAFKASLSPFAVVAVSGCIRTSQRPVVIEYAASTRGPWRSLGVIRTFSGSSCGTAPGYGTLFSGTFRAKYASAYYRAVFVRTPQSQGAVGGVVLLRKDPTKITSFAVTPRSVATNGMVTVSGRLWALHGSTRWQPYGGRRVIVVFRYHRTWYRYRAQPVTSAAGWFSGQFKVYASSPFFAQYNGDNTHFASASVRLGITATAKVPGSPLLRVLRPAGGVPLLALWHGEVRAS